MSDRKLTLKQQLSSLRNPNPDLHSIDELFTHITSADLLIAVIAQLFYQYTSNYNWGSRHDLALYIIGYVMELCMYMMLWTTAFYAVRVGMTYFLIDDRINAWNNSIGFPTHIHKLLSDRSNIISSPAYSVSETLYSVAVEQLKLLIRTLYIYCNLALVTD